MPRIDLLTAQMRQRAARRLSVQTDEKVQFFGANNEPLGSGPVLSYAMIHEFLLPIAPIPFDGIPVSFPYTGPDGEFKIAVGPHCRGFEIIALSPPPAQSRALANPTTPQIQATTPKALPVTTTRPTYAGGWSLGNKAPQIKPSTYYSPPPPPDEDQQQDQHPDDAA